jgi:hypothetical protein
MSKHSQACRSESQGHGGGPGGMTTSAFELEASTASSIAATISPVLQTHSTDQKRDRSQVVEES